MKDFGKFTNDSCTMFCLIDDSNTTACPAGTQSRYKPKRLCEHIIIFAGQSVITHNENVYTTLLHNWHGLLAKHSLFKRLSVSKTNLVLLVLILE